MAADINCSPPRLFQPFPDMDSPSAASPGLLCRPLYSIALTHPLAPALKEKTNNKT